MELWCIGRGVSIGRGGILGGVLCDFIVLWLMVWKGRLKNALRVELAPKSWTLIKAYSGTLCKLGSVCDRTQLFQFQTATLPVVVIHIVIYLLHQFIHRQFSCVIETLRL